MINNQNIEHEKIQDIARFLQGETGTNVMLSIIDKDTNKLKILTVKRNMVEIQTASLQNDDKFPIIKIKYFTNTTAKNVYDMLQTIEKQKPLGLIFDLRNNPGGILDAAIDVLSMILHQNSKITTLNYKKAEHNTTIFTKNDLNMKSYDHLPIAVLVDENSASASELFAAAVQENHKGIVFGAKTFGKGTIQNVIELNSIKNAVIKLTIAEYLTPNGNKINNNGVKIDYECNKNDNKCNIIELAKEKLRDYY